MSGRKLGIIIWKNLLLRKRQYIITSLEILVPIIAALIFVLTAGKSYQDDYRLKPETILEEKLLSVCKEDWCLLSASDPNVTKHPFIVYFPETPETTRVVEQVVDELCSNANITIGLVPAANASELENACDVNGKCRAAIVFPDELVALKTSPADKAASINYEIRMKKFTSGNLLPERTPAEGCSKEFTDFTRVGPNYDHLKSENDNGYYKDPDEPFKYFSGGFLGLQIAIEKVLAKMLTGVANYNHTISLRSFPYPPHTSPGYYKADSFQKFGYTFAFILIFMIPSITRNVVGEKQSGMTELLRSAGVSNWIQSVGWLIHATAFHLITVSFITIFFFVIKKEDGTAVMAYSDPSLVWASFYLSVLHTAAYVYFVSSLFQKPVPATIVAILIYLVMGLIGFFHVGGEGWLFDGKSELVFCVFPVLPFLLAMRIIYEFEISIVDDSDQPLGAHWNRINEVCSWLLSSSSNMQNGTFLEIMIVQLVCIFIYMALAMYFECVLPSQYGVKRPWYISDCKNTNSQRQAPVQSTSMTMASKESPNDEEYGTGVDERGEGSKSKASMKSQPTPSSETGGATIVPENSKKAIAMSSTQVGIDIQNVAKHFGDKVAVNGVSLQMYSGDIFALLGQNGAGKTTLISVITGWFSPTYGTVIVDGVDIRNDLDKARARMGLCPQQNMLFEYLTVSEHLWIFGMLRGRRLKEVKQEANTLLIQMRLDEKAKTAAHKLSGGQKRKLCLGMALIGETKVVVLDEPTSGMDPQARREIWDLLLELRGERTILLTTHFMEEADVLADRIGIMAEGGLQCVGTPAFLKKFYGEGYKLKITLGGGGNEGDKGSTAPSSRSTKAEAPPDSPDNVEVQAQPQVQQMSKEEIKEAVDALLTTVKKHIPDAALNSDLRSDPASPEVVFMLPSETATTKSLGTMFSDLTANRAKFKIKTMGLSQSSMEDVFLKVGELTEASQPDQAEMGTGHGTEEIVKSPKVQSGSQLLSGRFTALFIKRCIHFIRKWGLWIFQILLPFALFMTVVHLTYDRSKPKDNDYSVAATQSSNKGQGHSIPMTLASYNNPVTFYDTEPTHTNDYIKDVIGSSGRFYGDIVPDLLVKAKYDLKAYKRRYIIALDVIRTSNPWEIVAMYNTYPYHSAPLAINLASNLILKYLDPKGNRAIHLTSRPFDDDDNPSQSPSNQSRYPSGQKRSARLATYIMPQILPLGLLIIVTCFMVVPVEEKICQAKQLQTMSGASPALYWGSLFTFDYGILYFLITILMLIYMLIFDWNRVYSYGAGAVVFLLIVMIYGFSGILFSYLFSLRAGSVAGGFILVMLIHVVTGYGLGFAANEGKLGVPLLLQIIGRLFPSYSLVRALIRFGRISVKNANCRLFDDCDAERHTPYLSWTMNNENKYSNQFEAPVYEPGILQDLVILFCMGVIYALLLLLNEYILWRYSNNSNKSASPSNYPIDDDVQNEVDRVNNLIANGLTNEDCLLVENLSKSYADFAAVKSVTFGVHHGECFGLLGVNGVGKTTAFRMITGDAYPSSGDVYGFNTSLSGNAPRFFSNIGYCPQFDGFIPDFTGTEMLQLFAGLRGVPYRYRKIEAMSWLKKVGLLGSAKVRCKNYSGGMKRRLTTTMALIGDPALILLDEPTSGVDPVSRRQFWKILDNCRDSGQSVILTSHSMEECEALCSRLAIMVNGEFQCFGGVQHLKNKFAQGYSLILKLKTDDFPPDSPELQKKMNSLNEKVTEKFKPCTLKDKHQNLVQYHLENASITWDVLFKALEELKEEFEDFIEDFAVNETSLEEVFLAFAKVQDPERKSSGKASPIIRCLTCRC